MMVPTALKGPASTKFGAAAYGTVMTACALVQLVIGGSVPLVLILYIVAMTGLLPLVARPLTLSGMIFFSIALYSGGFALLIKTLLFHPAQQNLHSPDLSALILLVGHVAVTLAWALSSSLPIRIGFLERQRANFDNLGSLQFFSKFGFLLGYALAVLHVIVRPQFVNGSQSTTQGFGGFGGFYFILLLGFSAQAAICAIKQSKKEVLIGGIMFLAIGLLSVFANIKKDLLDAALIVGLTIVAFNVRIRFGYVVGALLFLGFVQFVVSPIIHVTRAQSQSKTISERIILTGDVLRQNNYDFGRINAKADATARGFQSNYRSSGSYVYPSTMNVDRFALILPIDQVARVDDPGRTSLVGMLGLTAQRVLPSVLVSKAPGTLADHVAWSYGFRLYGNIGRPVVGLTASTYAIGGIVGVAVMSFAVALALFWMIGAVGGGLNRSAWAVGFTVYLSILAEKEVDAIIGIMLRDIPLAIITLMLIFAFRRASLGGVGTARHVNHVRG